MVLFGLLLVPLGLGLAGFFLGKGRVTWKELLAHEGVMLVLILASYFIALHYKSSDVEIWSGTVRSKDKIHVNCCHSHTCDCRTVCSGSGRAQLPHPVRHLLPARAAQERHKRRCRLERLLR
jgi:hypothetical protein